MLLNITIAIAVLLSLNFILLKFSCNRISRKSRESKKPVILNARITSEESEELAPTGS
ncbi:hypothetical protein GCM10022260_22630 [Gaetbulibacter aestuarii]